MCLMRSQIRWVAVVVVMFLSMSTASFAASKLHPICTISLSQWENPNRNQTLLDDPALRTLIQSWEGKPGTRLLITYQAGEQGELWASRFQAWLVAYGIPREATRLSPVGNDSNSLTLSLGTSASVPGA